MRRSVIQLIALLITASARAEAPPAHAAPSQPSRALIHHVPLHEVLEGNTIVTFDVRDPQLAGAILVHVHRPNTKALAPIEALREGDGYHALIPAQVAAPPGFSYFVTERMPDGAVRPVFADAARPHDVRVSRPAAVEEELHRLAGRDGQRSTLTLSADAIDFGDRKLGPAGTVHDRYYRLEAGYAYSFLTHIDSIRLSIVRVRGEGASWTRGDLADSPPTVDDTSPGIDYGRAEVAFLAHDELRLRAALLLGASQRGFEYGGGGSAVLGDPKSTSLEVGVERITTLGTTGKLRLGFAALPRVPMGATIEISSFPTGDDSGVRLLYDVGYRFGPVTQLVLRGGYQGRTSVTGGPALGATFDYGF